MAWVFVEIIYENLFLGMKLEEAERIDLRVLANVISLERRNEYDVLFSSFP